MLLDLAGSAPAECWSTDGRQPYPTCLVAVQQNSEEYRAAAAHLRQTLDGMPVQIGSLLRVENAQVYAAYRETPGEMIMFHGCKTQQNDAIVARGFDQSLCRSGGTNYGVWFAYNASYSDGSFAFTGPDGWRHLFLCRVSKDGLKKDDSTMRVVSQRGAVPMWIIKYRR